MKHITLAKTVLLTILLISALLLTACNSGNPLAENFSLSDSELTLMEGKTATLEINDLKSVGRGSYTVFWTADNSEVATVDSAGTVMGKGVGTCTVTAVVRMNEEEIQFSCAVTVVENNTALSALSFKASIYTIGDKQTLNLRDEVTLYPEDAPIPKLTWSSSNAAIASVSDGLVIPSAPGIATVKVSTADGSVFASCVVQVSANTVQATAVAFNETELFLSLGQTKILKANVTPADATGYSITWTSSDPNVVSVDGGVLSALSEGDATVTATLNMATGVLIATCDIHVQKVTVEVEATRVTLIPDTMTLLSTDTTEYSIDMKVEPANCTQSALWTSNRPDLLLLDEKTGKFCLTEEAAFSESVAILVTCTIGNQSAVAVIYVEKPAAIVTVEPGEITLFDKAPKNTETLYAFLDHGSEPMTNAIWKSSDPTVATVDKEGKVTALKIGACVITASYEKDGKTYSDSCAVTVEEAPYLLLTVGETVEIPAKLLPAKPSANPEKWYYEESFLEIDFAKKTVKALAHTEIMLRVSIESEDGKESTSFDICIIPGKENPDTSGSNSSNTSDSSDITDSASVTDSQGNSDATAQSVASDDTDTPSSQN